jgi:hypothetical protein
MAGTYLATHPVALQYSGKELQIVASPAGTGCWSIFGLHLRERELRRCEQSSGVA